MIVCQIGTNSRTVLKLAKCSLDTTQCYTRNYIFTTQLKQKIHTLPFVKLVKNEEYGPADQDRLLTRITLHQVM